MNTVSSYKAAYGRNKFATIFWSEHFVESLVLSVSDFSWLCPLVSRPSVSILCPRLCVMILSQLWTHIVPVSHLGIVRLPLEWLPVSLLGWLAEARFEPRTSRTKAWCSTNWAISTIYTLFGKKLDCFLTNWQNSKYSSTYLKHFWIWWLGTKICRFFVPCFDSWCSFEFTINIILGRFLVRCHLLLKLKVQR